MGYLRLAQALETLIGQADEPAALVGRVRGSLDESGLGPSTTVISPTTAFSWPVW